MEYFNEHQIQLAIICSLVSFGVTQVVKPFWKKDMDKERAAALTRLAAILSGGLVGYTLTYTVVDLWLGMGVGGVNALAVKLLKRKLNLQGDSEKKG